MPKEHNKKYQKEYNKKNVIVLQILCLCIFSLILNFCSDSNNSSSKQPSTFSFPKAEIQIVFDDAMVIDQIASGGNETGVITYTSSTTSVATVHETTGAVTIVGVGSTIITATREVEADANAVTAMYTLTVRIGTDTLTFLETRIEAGVGDAEITDQIAIGGNGKGAITYTSDDTNVATVNVNSGTVTIVAVGETTITATRASDTNYKLISASYTLAVIVLTPIRTIAELKNIKNNLDGNYALAANIDLSGETNWTPIGDETAKFTGTINGRAYNINGLNSSEHRYAGLFGFMANAKIKNLKLVVGNISASSSFRRSYAGGLVAYAENSSVSNSCVRVEGDISAATSGPHAGGLIGYAKNSSIKNSSTIINGNISSSTSSQGAYAAGSVGFLNDNSSINNSYTNFTGNISASASGSAYVGGLVGLADNNSSISNSYVDLSGNISVLTSSASGAYAGGLLGLAFRNSSIKNSYADIEGDISSSTPDSFGDSYAGGLIGRILRY